MADANDTAADDGQWTTTTEDTMNIIDGPGPPQGAVDTTVDATVDEGGNVNNNEDMDNGRYAPRRTFKNPEAAQNGPLLTLPAEVQNMIFKLCLCHPEDIGEKLKLKWKKVESFTLAANYVNRKPRPQLMEAYEFSYSSGTRKAIRKHSLRNPALMRTCQAVYNDAAPVFWAQRFTFRNITDLQHFLLSPYVRHDLVRDINVWSVDYVVGRSLMPAISHILAEKVKGLERFEVDMSNMRAEKYSGYKPEEEGFQDVEHLKEAGKNLGFGIYSYMHPWVTEVVCRQGIDKFMKILQIVRERAVPLDSQSRDVRVYRDFQRRGQLSENQRAIADAATAEEIVRLIDLYEKKP